MKKRMERAMNIKPNLNNVLSFGKTPQERLQQLEAQINGIVYCDPNKSPFQETINKIAGELAYDMYEKRQADGGDVSYEAGVEDFKKASDIVMEAYRTLLQSKIGYRHFGEKGTPVAKEDKPALRQRALDLLS